MLRQGKESSPRVFEILAGVRSFFCLPELLEQVKWTTTAIPNSGSKVIFCAAGCHSGEAATGVS